MATQTKLKQRRKTMKMKLALVLVFVSVVGFAVCADDGCAPCKGTEGKDKVSEEKVAPEETVTCPSCGSECKKDADGNCICEKCNCKCVDGKCVCKNCNCPINECTCGEKKDSEKSCDSEKEAEDKCKDKE